MSRSMALAGYILVPGSHFAGMWRHPFSEVNFCDPQLYEDVARTLERGGFDLAFIPESLSVPTGPGNDYQTFLRHGAVGAVRHDPALLACVMAGATRSLGFTVTLSTTYMEPYHIARTLSTLDHFSKGRVSWNIVTSAGPSNGHNFGHYPKFEFESVYRRADETLEVCMDLWRSWEADALVCDKQSGIYADTENIAPIEHEGEFFKVRGPLSLPTRPEGPPVLMSVGVSPRGRDFSARWADVVFAIQNDAAGMAELRNDVRRRAAEKGRDPEKVRLMAAVQPILGETDAIAKARAEHYDELIHPELAKAFLSGMLGIDLKSYPSNTPIDEVLAALDRGKNGNAAVDAGATRPWLDRIRAECPDRCWTIGEIATRMARSTSTPRLIGTAAHVADQLEEFFVSEACDGFVITPTHFPGSFDEFCRSVVPELRARGLVRDAAEDGVDLRTRLGLEQAGDAEPVSDLSTLAAEMKTRVLRRVG
jgi:FMN-dependent oxidoreductase (nitrilotriacetate monooxygenase family)